ncbi:hypothetical protein JCM11491_004965 [Sporobolomyces phaffii]
MTTPLVLKMAYSRLSDQDRERYDALYISAPNRMLPEELAIFRTNGFGFGAGNRRSGLFFTGSRFNHSCRPNVHRHWDEQKRCEWFIANRDVARGQELCISYQEIRASEQTRRRDLGRGYGFDCACEACTLSEEETSVSNARRVKIKSLDDSTIAQRGRPDRLVPIVELVLQLLEEEDISTGAAELALDALTSFICMGDEPSASRWIDRFLELEKKQNGIWSSNYEQVAAWKGNLTRHPGWNFFGRTHGGHLDRR